MENNNNKILSKGEGEATAKKREKVRKNRAPTYPRHALITQNTYVGVEVGYAIKSLSPSGPPAVSCADPNSYPDTRCRSPEHSRIHSD